MAPTTHEEDNVAVYGFAADDVFQALAEDIFTGKISGGAKLHERTLAEQFGTSRGPVREAVNRLMGRGLVVRKPNAGVTVRTVSKSEVIQFYEFRAIFEWVAAGMAARNITTEGAELLQSSLDAQRRALDAGAPKYHLEGLKFHQVVSSITGNRYFTEFLGAEFYCFLSICRQQFGYQQNRGAHAIDEHLDIFEAIRTGDAELAEFLSRRHVNKALENARKILLVENENKNAPVRVEMSAATTPDSN